MRNAIVGGIGALWGGLIVVNWLFNRVPSDDEAYRTGQAIGAMLGVAMFAAGVYYFIIGIRELQPAKPKKKTQKRKRPKFEDEEI